MSKKIFFALMIGLISSNSLLAMIEEEDGAEFSHKTTTVQVPNHNLWVHVKAHRKVLKEISADAWVTSSPDENFQPRVVVDSIRLEVHGDFSSGWIEKTNVHTHHVSAKPGFTSPVANAFFKRSDFGEVGPVHNSAT
ncbi:MAG: hypothetical protein K2X39_08455 [Silvanigrellaceae bacterium]|nr:hypothetical protein [Silvanigrellaceae bacterium]